MRSSTTTPGLQRIGKNLEVLFVLKLLRTILWNILSGPSLIEQASAYRTATLKVELKPLAFYRCFFQHCPAQISLNTQSIKALRFLGVSGIDVTPLSAISTSLSATIMLGVTASFNSASFNRFLDLHLCCLNLSVALFFSMSRYAIFSFLKACFCPLFCLNRSFCGGEVFVASAYSYSSDSEVIIDA